ncbi:MAG: hypothetical protein CMF59_11465 [Leptospiraceae bacterium]|nr:hypothetical protein [Leptospiraceae bacterium]
MKLAISPCPNDTYIFHWMIHNPAGPRFEPVYLDIQELNEEARAGRYELTKMSCYAFLKMKDQYTMLESGGALGRGCGPLLVSSQVTGASRKPTAELLQYLAEQKKPILIPGMETTASLMLRMYLDSLGYSIPLKFLRYDQILPALRDGEFEAGVIIHEERFTYPTFNTDLVQDLGEWWEQSTGSPIPLGLIAIRNDYLSQKEEITEIIRNSLKHANDRPIESSEYIRCHAQAMEDQAIRDHIALYVNDYSMDMGPEGLKAMEELERRARQAGAL